MLRRQTSIKERAIVSKRTLTLALNGDIQLADFAKAIDCFRRLVDGLSDEVAPTSEIVWRVDSLESGSAIATVRGFQADETTDGLPTVVDAYEKTAEALSKKLDVPFSARVGKPASQLLSLINGHITSIRFETETFDAEVFSSASGKCSSEPFEVTIGAVSGRVQSLSNRGGLRFTLYDDLDDHAISCYVTPGSEDAMREAWGRLVTVEGMVRRNAKTGQVATVRQAQIQIVDEGGPCEYREAIGCAPAVPGSISAEEAVRRIRDA